MTKKKFSAASAAIELTVVVDNTIDIFLEDKEHVQYPKPGKCSSLLAEQGLALWLEVRDEKGGVTRILYDFGRSETVLKNNLSLLDLDPSKLDMLILSHGHIDHYGGLLWLLKNSPSSCPLIVHPKAFGPRGVMRPDGKMAGPWCLNLEEIKNLRTAPIVTVEGPFQAAPGICVSGAIPRKSKLDVPFKSAVRMVDDELQPDLLEDDMALIVNIEGMGILVITGCCHAGLINTLEIAEVLFPGQTLIGILGGLHLNNIERERLDSILGALAKRNPKYIIPLHCTGALAQHALLECFGDSFMFGTVGARFTF